MIAGLGSLEIRLLADISSLKREMDQAKSYVGSAATSIQGAANTVRNALGALGVGLSVGAIVNWVRNAINAADALDEMSSRLGISARELSSLQLAYQMAGMGGDKMQTSLAKLSQEIVRGNSAFDQLGIKTRNADGSMRGATAVLRDTADAFAGMTDGTAKTALAMEIFGKSGAEMVGLLNEGSAGLDEMTDMARRLGMVIDDDVAAQAAEFNDTLDLIGGGMRGVAQQVMAQMLPTLRSLAGTFLGAMTQGEGLNNIAKLIGGTFKALFTAGFAVVEVFSTVGTTIGAAAAQLVAVLQGDFKGAVDIGKQWAGDIRQSWASSAQRIMDVWNEAGGESVQQMTRMASRTRAVTEATTDSSTALGGQQSEMKKAADEARKHREQMEKLSQAGKDYVTDLEEKLRTVRKEINLGRTLTDEEKQLLDLEAKLKEGKMSLTEAEKERAQGLITETNAAIASRDLARELAKLRVNEINATLDSSAEIAKQVEEIRKQNVAYGKSERELQDLELARLDDALATAEQRLQMALLTGLSADELEGITMTVEELRKLKRAKQEGWALAAGKEAADAAKATADEWKKTVKSIEDGLVGALMRAFESGKGFMDAFKSVLINSFKTMVLEPTIRAIVSPVAQVMGQVMQPITGSITNAVGSLFGMPGLGGGNGIISAMGLPGMGTLAGMGSAFSGGFGLTMSGLSGTGLALEGAGAMMAGGELGAGLAQAAGALGPYVLAALAVAALIKKFDKSGTPHMGSVVGTNMFGEQSSVWGDPSTIMNNYNKDIDAALRGLSGVSVGSLNTLSRAFGGRGGFSALARFASDNTDPSIAHFQLSRYGAMVGSIGGDDDWKKYTKDAQAAFGDYTKDVTRLTREMLDQIQLPEWAREQFEGLADESTLEDFARMAEAIAMTQEGLRSLIHAINPLGTIFTDVAGLSSDALKELTDFAGGIDAFAQKTNAYVSAYYTEPEQAALQARQIRQTLRAAGLTRDELRGLDTREEFRALVESRDVTTAAGREQLAALLTVAPAFAGLVEYLGKNKQTLMNLSDTAPAMEALNSIIDPSMKTATAAETTAERLQSSNVLLQTINGTLTDMADRQIAVLGRVETQLRDINESTKRTADTAADYWNP